MSLALECVTMMAQNMRFLSSSAGMRVQVVQSPDNPGPFVAEYGSGEFAEDVRLRLTAPDTRSTECLELPRYPERAGLRPCNDMEPRQASHDCAFYSGDKLNLL